MGKIDFSKLKENRNNGIVPSAKDEMNKINAIDDGNIFKIVPIEQMRPSPLNNFGVRPESVTLIKESIKETGRLIHNLLLMPVDDDGSGVIYEILSGEQRYYALLELINEGHQKFQKGVPSMLTEKGLSETKQKIIIREANIKQREYDPKTIRQNVEDLATLYRKLHEEENNGDSTTYSPTKKIAEAIGKSERTVQRLISLERLIPELKEMFDSGKIKVENASHFANMSEDDQYAVLELLKENASLTKKEAEQALALQKEIETQKEAEIERLNKLLIQSNEDKNNIEKVLSSKDEEFKKIQLDAEKEIALYKEREEEKQKQLEIALKNNNPNNEEIEKLKEEINNLNIERQKKIEQLENSIIYEKETKEIELKKKDEEITAIKKKLEDTQNQLENSKSKVSETEKEKILTEIQIKSLSEIVVKNVQVIKEKIAEALNKGLQIDIPSELNEIHSMLNDLVK